jgi:ferredoxin
VRSEAGCRAESLRAAVGGHHQQLFDFQAMSRLLSRAPPARPLPERRRARIEAALATLRSQQFFPAAVGASPDVYAFEFRHGEDAIRAFRERVPAMVALVKAMALAELEAGGRYVEAMHDPFFAAYDEQVLSPSDLEFFPDYLVCLERTAEPAQHVTLMELLSAGIPVKVLVQVDDLLEDGALGEGHVAFGVRSMQLASTAVALGDCYVLQSASSNLCAVQRSVERGMDYAGPALFSVFSGAAGRGSSLPPYLVAAAAMQSRAFPAFTFDPSAGEGLADRFSLEDNPQPDVDWPVARLEFADGELQRVAELAPFTFLDFVACDVRYARHFARVPHAAWSESMVPAADWLAAPAALGADCVPFILTVDDDDVLHRVIADEPIMRAARRCRETWHRLQELGGVHNSHAERRLARERGTWEADKAREIEAIRASSTSVPAGVAPVEAIVVPAEAQPIAAAPDAAERSKDEAYIETARCSSCNECTQINDRMFAYNDDKQAYIKDVTAGTYRQLVDAAESCQLSIIHPGKPRDPNEPGLPELIERAQPFL